MAGAETFKCRRSDGTVMYTNDPAQAPGDCVMEKVTDLPPIGILPEAPRQPAAPQSAARSTPPPADFALFKSEAQGLVDDYQSTRQRVFRSSLVKDQQEAKRQLAELRVQRDGLLAAIDQAALSVAEREELAGLLAVISE